MSQRIRQDVLKYLSKRPDDTTGVRANVSGTRGEIIAAIQSLNSDKLIQDVRSNATLPAKWMVTAAGLKAIMDETK